MNYTKGRILVAKDKQKRKTTVIFYTTDGRTTHKMKVYRAQNSRIIICLMEKLIIQNKENIDKSFYEYGL